MNTAQKSEAIELLKDKFSQYSNFYVTNTESLTVAQINKLRRTCFEKNVEMKVAKNTLIRKALESLNSEKYAGIYDALHGVTALMFSDSPKEPAVIISAFRNEAKGEKPALKAAFIGEDLFIGDNQLTNLKNIKTKNELIGEVIGLLQSPISRVISALQNKAEQEGGAAPEAAPDAPATDAPEASAPEAPAAE
ncbi:50S ribosomal protein L10 [Taibaiella koreensis]|uniref:50S ribosomal protein L10 n=1 Tax=Taibaiella koreensis TaxID=1268548 RepID=UPI000E59FB40|nr:50S ribosomal protein L10 [Taibaiella koreensis]